MAEPSVHPLSGAYLDLIDATPERTRARRATEDSLAAQMSSGQHVVVRGFGRSGKSTMLKGVLARAVDRTGGAALIINLADSVVAEKPTIASVREWLSGKIQEFLKRVGAEELKASPETLLTVLGELAAPLFVGFDTVEALLALPSEDAASLLGALLKTPKNVKVIAACALHRQANVFVDAALAGSTNVFVHWMSSIGDDELVELVQTPAQEHGVTFSNEALGVIAEVSGNRPYDALVLAHVVASRLPAEFKGTVDATQVETAIDLDSFSANEEGQRLVQLSLHTLVSAMSPEERVVMEMLAAGTEGEAAEDALGRLQATGFVLGTDEGYAVNGALLDGLTRAVVDGEIKVSVE